MTKVSEIYPSRWAKPVEDLKNNTIITIQGPMIEREGTDFDGNNTILHDLEISYENADKEITTKLFQLNAGNAKAIAEVYGDDDANWKGKEMACVLIASPKSKSGKRVVLIAPSKTILAEALK